MSPAKKGRPLGYRVLCFFITFPNVSWSTSESRVRLALWNLFRPTSKILNWPFQGGTSFVDLICFFCLVFVMPLRVCLFVHCSHLLGTGWPLGFCLWCITVSLSPSKRYPVSGVVLDCINSWSLHPYLLWNQFWSFWEWPFYTGFTIIELPILSPEWHCFNTSPKYSCLIFSLNGSTIAWNVWSRICLQPRSWPKQYGFCFIHMK